MAAIDVRSGQEELPALPRIALLTTVHVSEIDPLGEVVLLRGRGMGPVAAALNRARSTGRRVPPVVVIAPAIDPADIVHAFSGGPVSYSLEGTSRPALDDLLRLAAQGQHGLHPDVLRTLLRQAGAEPCRATAPLPTTVPLTTREEEIMSLLAAGHEVATIADRLRLSQKTVRNNLTRIFAKLHVRRQTEAVLKWRGLV